jgi:hypothetical protein
MPEYDAFGREIGEDTLAGLGGEPGTTPQPIPSSIPADGWSERTDHDHASSPGSTSSVFAGGSEVPIAPPPQPQGPQPGSFTIPGQIPVAGRPKKARKGMGGLGCLIGLLVLAAVVAGPIIAIVAIVGDTAGTIESVRDGLEEAQDGITATVPPAEDAGPPPTGIGGRSMIRPDNLDKAIKVLRRQDGRLGRMTLWPERVNADLVARRDTYRNVALWYDGRLDVGDPIDVGIVQDVIGWDRIDPRVPARMVVRSAKRFDLNPARIDYLIGEVDAFDDEPLRWVAYFKGGVIIQGDENGRPERRIS